MKAAYGWRLQTARRKAGLTQDQLAARLGLSRSSVANIESGRQGVGVDGVFAHARALDVDPAWLLTGRESVDHLPPVQSPVLLGLLLEAQRELEDIAVGLSAVAGRIASALAEARQPLLPRGLRSND